MSRILALDAATEGCSVALYLDGAVTMKMEIAPQAHTKLMLPMVDELLQKANLRLSDLDVLACGKGPGSFTGVRIGVSFAHGLALGAELKIVGVGDLEALAYRAMQEANTRYAIVAFDARMGEVYLGIYKLDDDNLPLALMDNVVVPPSKAKEHMLDVLEKIEVKGVAVAGTGFDTYTDLASPLALRNGQSINFSKVTCKFPDAEAIAKIAAHRLTEAVLPEEFLPLYVRDTVTWKKVSEQEALKALKHAHN